MRTWFRNVGLAITTIAQGMYVTLWNFVQTFRRKAFTQHFEYPEQPVPVRPRYRGFHRFDLTTCIGCDKCAAPARSIASTSTRRRTRRRQGVRRHRLQDRLHEVHVLCAVRRSVPGRLHLHGLEPTT